MGWFADFLQLVQSVLLLVVGLQLVSMPGILGVEWGGRIARREGIDPFVERSEVGSMLSGIRSR